MTTTELARVARFCRIKKFGRGEMVFRAGEVCDSFHMVAAGQVKLFVGSPQGHEKVIEIFSAGQSFAEAIMFLDKPYIFNAQALTDAVMVEVTKDGVYTEIARDPKFAMHMLGGVSRRSSTLIQDVEAYTRKNGKQRLIEFLLGHLQPATGSDAQAAVVTLPANKTTVASRLSLTPEYFSRVLHDLEDQGLISIDRRIICIRDLRALKQNAEN